MNALLWAPQLKIPMPDLDGLLASTEFSVAMKLKSTKVYKHFSEMLGNEICRK